MIFSWLTLPIVLTVRGRKSSLPRQITAPVQWAPESGAFVQVLDKRVLTNKEHCSSEKAGTRPGSWYSLVTTVGKETFCYFTSHAQLLFRCPRTLRWCHSLIWTACCVSFGAWQKKIENDCSIYHHSRSLANIYPLCVFRCSYSWLWHSWRMVGN